MPRYLLQRTFPNGLGIPSSNEGAKRSVISPRRCALGMTVMIALISGVLAGPGAAAKRTTVKFTAIEKGVAFKTDSNFPAVGSMQTQLATTKTKAFGGGQKTEILTAKVTKQDGANISYSVTGTDFYADGTQLWTATGLATVAGDGTILLKGSAKYVGGTGLYRGASGSFTFTGTQAPNDPITTTTSKGSLTY